MLLWGVYHIIKSAWLASNAYARIWSKSDIRQYLIIIFIHNWHRFLARVMFLTFQLAYTDVNFVFGSTINIRKTSARAICAKHTTPSSLEDRWWYIFRRVFGAKWQINGDEVAQIRNLKITSAAGRPGSGTCVGGKMRVCVCVYVCCFSIYISMTTTCV